MTDLIHKCTNNPAWAESCIESLTAENTRLRGRVEAVKKLEVRVGPFTARPDERWILELQVKTALEQT